MSDGNMEADNNGALLALLEREKKSDYLTRVKYFLGTMNARYLFYTRSNIMKNLEICENKNKGIYDPDEILSAEEVKHAFIHPEYYLWAKKNNKDPVQYAGYSRMLRYFEYVPVNMTLAWAILLIPPIPFLNIPFRTRGVLYNMINRLYCITFDYQHRNPTHQELEDYTKVPFIKRLFKNYAEDNDQEGFDFSLGVRYGADIACAFGFTWILYTIAKKVQAIKRTPPKNLYLRIAGSTWKSFWAPGSAVCIAHFFDILFARWNEIKYGSCVYDENGSIITNPDSTPTLSAIGARDAVGQTFVQRCMTVWLALGLGSFCNAVLSHTGRMPKNVVAKGMVGVLACGLGLTISVPMSLGLFDTYLGYKSDKLESEFHGLINPDGTPITLYVYRGD
eukprot:TRINITY_DN2479_c0_g1_i1.p1 TRINITY_DN2479_c0_g1~~TRINITY_DN2479_c0_g1_i1.p1  ORF type:complete len:392 (-),score=68.95 TRINITY_DN2479_c0_g1_i1:24-1199(-)